MEILGLVIAVAVWLSLLLTPCFMKNNPSKAFVLLHVIVISIGCTIAVYWR